jgi:hypothetical protein
MTLFHEIGATVLLVILTLWLQSARIAALAWPRDAVSQKTDEEIYSRYLARAGRPD